MAISEGIRLLQGNCCVDTLAKKSRFIEFQTPLQDSLHGLVFRNKEISW